MLRPLLRPLLQPLLRGPMEPNYGNSVAPPPSTNLMAWYSKGTGITSSANAVSAWADQSGNTRHLVQATGSAQPTLQGDGTIIFDGTADRLVAVFAVSAPVTMYLRMKQITWSADKIIAGLESYGSGILQRGTTPEIAIFGGSYVANNSALALNTWGNVAAGFASAALGAGSFVRINATTLTGSPGAHAGLTGFMLGANDDGFGPTNIQVAEVLLYSALHDATTQDQVFTYLSTR
jgi:hypothetical protein